MTTVRMELTVTLVRSLLWLLVVGGAGGVVRGPGSLASHTPAWPHPYWDIPGRYCSAHYPALACCPGRSRQDRCNVPILDTLCYCDTFCNRWAAT